MTDSRWQFWIDVGGTFTDCIANTPNGAVLQHKILSTGVVKGCVGDGSTPNAIVDMRRRSDPPDFWTGFALRLLTDSVIEEIRVTGFDSKSGTLQLASANQ